MITDSGSDDVIFYSFFEIDFYSRHERWYIENINAKYSIISYVFLSEVPGRALRSAPVLRSVLDHGMYEVLILRDSHGISRCDHMALYHHRWMTRYGYVRLAYGSARVPAAQIGMSQVSLMQDPHHRILGRRDGEHRYAVGTDSLRDTSREMLYRASVIRG